MIGKCFNDKERDCHVSCTAYNSMTKPKCRILHYYTIAKNMGRPSLKICLARAQIKIKGLVIEINEDFIRFSTNYNDFKVTMEEIDRILDISPANILPPWARRDYFRCLKTC